MLLTKNNPTLCNKWYNPKQVHNTFAQWKPKVSVAPETKKQV